MALSSSDFDELEIEQACDLAERARVVAYAEGAVVRRSGQRLAFGRDHLEVAFAVLGYAEDGDGSRLDAELDGDAVAGLAVVDTKAPQKGLLVADGDVPRAVVAHEDEVIVEVHGVELGERSTSAQRVHDLHGH